MPSSLGPGGEEKEDKNDSVILRYFARETRSYSPHVVRVLLRPFASCLLRPRSCELFFSNEPRVSAAPPRVAASRPLRFAGRERAVSDGSGRTRRGRSIAVIVVYRKEKRGGFSGAAIFSAVRLPPSMYYHFCAASP